jgi:4-aminobutyrate aminotransferase/(S)-3-amino-2-methylpropionate transaminase
MSASAKSNRPPSGPTIRVAPPGPKSRRAFARKNAVVTHGLKLNLPIAVDWGKGPLVGDVDGNVYVDLTTGIGVHNTGHCPEAITRVAARQLAKLTHTCFMVTMYEPYIALAERMAKTTPRGLTMTLWQNSGSEAVENAIKISRAATGRKHIISFRSAFHGRTLLDISLSGKMKPYKEGFGPFVAEVAHADYAYCYRCPLKLTYPKCKLACVDTIRKMMDKAPLRNDVACLISEPIQGEGGFIVPPPGYFEKLLGICRERGILFIDDEVQAGMGRAGKMWAIEHWRAVPDMLVSGKAIGGGLPLAGVTGTPKIMKQPGPGSLGGTFGGSPVSCEAALVSIDLVEKALPRVPKLHELIARRLGEIQERCEIVGDVRGKGAMMAIELVRDRGTKEIYPEAARAIQMECLQRGVLILTAGFYNNVIRLLPPLNIPLRLMDRSLGILAEAVAAVDKARP